MRQADLSQLPLSAAHIQAAIDLIDAELLAVEPGAPAPARQVDFTTQAHNGVGWNTELDRLHARIASAANLRGRPIPANAVRLFDHRTGNHDSSRLHDELDRLHARIDRLRHTPGYSVTKATDNTRGGIWPGSGFGSLISGILGSWVLRLDVISWEPGPFAFRWSWAGTQDTEVFTGWMSGQEVSIASPQGTLTFTVPGGTSPPSTTPGTYFTDTVVVAYP